MIFGFGKKAVKTAVKQQSKPEEKLQVPFYYK
jgi:hypothetical protein